MVGQFGVGKTSLVRRFVDSIFRDDYISSIGVKIDRKDVTVGTTAVTLMLWDPAGEDDLKQLSVAHLRRAAGYILVADGCRATTFEKALELQVRIEQLLGPLPFVMVLNKADLRDGWEIGKTDSEQRGWSTYETSAKDGTGVEEMFHSFAERLVNNGAANEDSIE